MQFLCMILTSYWHPVSIALHGADLLIMISPPLGPESVHILFMLFAIKGFWNTIIISLLNLKVSTLMPICGSNAYMFIGRIFPANFLMVCTNLFSDIYGPAILTLEKWLFSFDHKNESKKLNFLKMLHPSLGILPAIGDICHHIIKGR